MTRYTFKKLQELTILYTTIHTIHLLAAFTYGGFLLVDMFFLSKMPQTLNANDAVKAREAVMMHVRKVVPNALLLTVATGIYMISQVFGPIGEEGLTSFQMILLLKAFLGLWLGIRGFNQKFFKINPFVFKGHTLPFAFVVSIIILSQFMWL